MCWKVIGDLGEKDSAENFSFGWIQGTGCLMVFFSASCDLIHQDAFTSHRTITAVEMDGVGLGLPKEIT